jgi:hypothetical protein
MLIGGQRPSEATSPNSTEGKPRHALLAQEAPPPQRIGPLAVGLVNDALKNGYGADAVRYCLLSAAVATTIGALLFALAARSIRADIQRAS